MDLFLLNLLALLSMDKLVVGNMFLFLTSSQCYLWLTLLLMLISRPDPAEEMPREMRHCSWQIGAWPSSSRLRCRKEWAGKEENNENFHHSESLWPRSKKVDNSGAENKNGRIWRTSRDQEMVRYIKLQTQSRDCEWRRMWRNAFPSRIDLRNCAPPQPGQKGQFSK